MKARGRWASLAVVMVMLSACAGTPAPRTPVASPLDSLVPAALAPGERLRVLATTSIVADVVGAIGGSRIQVSALIPAGVDPHAFEPTPQDARRVAEAHVIFENGLGLEAFLEDLVRSAGAGVPVISVSERIEPLLAGGLDAQAQHEGEGEAQVHDHGIWDPHVWLDPRNVIEWTGVIEDALSALDPQGAAEYARAAEAYRLELQALDGEVESLLAVIPSAQRRLVTDHEEFAYFARRYGFEVVGTVIPAVSTVAEPSARELAMLEDAIRSSGARAVFVSSGVNPALARRVAQDTGVQLVTVHVASLSDAAPTYLELMRLNARLMVEALAG